MANLTESETYDAGVYQLETGDPVLGGADGASNAPHKNLANRTKYLKKQIDDILSGVANLVGYAKINNPTFTGSPAAPTQALGDNTTKLATDAFVQSTIGAVLNKSVAGGSNVTLTAVEAGHGILRFTGALTANISVIVPTSPTRNWNVVNATTGAYTLTVKTAGGSGVVVTQGKVAFVWTDGTSVYDSLTDFDSISISGVSTCPTRPRNTNDESVASTAFVQAAGSHYLPTSGLSLSASQTLDLTYAGHWLAIDNEGLTITLPLLSTTDVGLTTYRFVCLHDVIIQRSGSDVIAPARGTTISTLYLQAGEWVELTSNGDGLFWYITGKGSDQGAGAFLGNQVLTADLTMSWKHVNKTFKCAVPGLFVALPTATHVQDGDTVSFVSTASGTPASILRSGTDAIDLGNGNTGLTSFLLKGGESITLVYSGGVWAAVGRCAELGKLAAFASTLAASGDQLLPSGLRLKWGTWTASGSGGAAVTVMFNEGFPDGVCYGVFPYVINNATGVSSAWLSGAPAYDSFSARCNIANAVCGYFAIGH